MYLEKLRAANPRMCLNDDADAEEDFCGDPRQTHSKGSLLQSRVRYTLLILGQRATCFNAVFTTHTTYTRAACRML